MVKMSKMFIFALPITNFCGCGEIGRHARLRIWCREVCGFESLHLHCERRNPSLFLVLRSMVIRYRSITNEHYPIKKD